MARSEPSRDNADGTVDPPPLLVNGDSSNELIRQVLDLEREINKEMAEHLRCQTKYQEKLDHILERLGGGDFSRGRRDQSDSGGSARRALYTSLRTSEFQVSEPPLSGEGGAPPKRVSVALPGASAAAAAEDPFEEETRGPEGFHNRKRKSWTLGTKLGNEIKALWKKPQNKRSGSLDRSA